jgi:hypothetical protein
MLVGKGNVFEAMILDAASGKIMAATANFALKKYEAEIAQEDGTDKLETVDETPNILKVRRYFIFGALSASLTLNISRLVLGTAYEGH